MGGVGKCVWVGGGGVGRVGKYGEVWEIVGEVCESVFGMWGGVGKCV